MRLHYKTVLRFYVLITVIFVHFNATADDYTESNTATATITLGVTEVSLLKASEVVINLQLNQQEAGQSVESSKSDSTARLLVSSVISTSSTRTLTAKITGGVVPVGTHLDLVAMQPNANFVGSHGTIAPPITLDGTDKPVITGIASCYSGTGVSDGYPLKFTYALDLNSSTYESLRASSGTQVVITFTLTAVQ